MKVAVLCRTIFYLDIILFDAFVINIRGALWVVDMIAVAQGRESEKVVPGKEVQNHVTIYTEVS